MGIWKTRKSETAPATPAPARPASRQQADDIRRRAQHYTDITEQPGKQGNDRRKATQQRRQAEQDMAALRAETLQARRLANRIENLHQPSRSRRKGLIMDTTMADPGQAQRMKRRSDDAPSPGGGKFNFNPLHPSMELPPEQLIRLLGLENKTKRRRKQATPATARQSANPADHAARETTPVKLSLPDSPPASAERERDTVPPSFDDTPRRFVIPSLMAGAVAGIVISVYLFWGAPDETPANARPAATQAGTATHPGTVKPARAAQPPEQNTPVDRTPGPTPDTAPAIPDAKPRTTRTTPPATPAATPDTARPAESPRALSGDAAPVEPPTTIDEHAVPAETPLTVHEDTVPVAAPPTVPETATPVAPPAGMREAPAVVAPPTSVYDGAAMPPVTPPTGETPTAFETDAAPGIPAAVTPADAAGAPASITEAPYPDTAPQDSAPAPDAGADAAVPGMAAEPAPVQPAPQAAQDEAVDNIAEETLF